MGKKLPFVVLTQGMEQMVFIVGFKKFYKYHDSSTPEGTPPDIIIP
jgi:hypothetical protein